MKKIKPIVNNNIVNNNIVNNFKFNNSSYDNNIDINTSINSIGKVEELDFTKDISNNFDYYNIEKDGFTVQGYTYINDEDGNKIFITAYDGNHQDNSRIYMYDSNSGKLLGKVILNNKNHVGGITYDEDNKIIFVSANDGMVETYDYVELSKIFRKINNIDAFDDTLRLDFDSEDLDDYERNQIKYNFNRCIISNNINVKELISKNNIFNSRMTENLFYQDGMDSVYFYNGVLYSNTYAYNGELVSTSFNINRDLEGKITSIDDGVNHSKSKVVGNVGSAVQGLSFYNDNGKEYLVTSSSAKNFPSVLTKYEIGNDGSINNIGSKTISRQGLEGINIDDNGNITGIFEYTDGNMLNIGDNIGFNFIIGNVNELNNNVDIATDSLLKVGGTYWNMTNGEDDYDE